MIEIPYRRVKFSVKYSTYVLFLSIKADFRLKICKIYRIFCRNVKRIKFLSRQKFGQKERKFMARHGENIYKRKDGRWEGRYRNGCKPNGSTRYSSVYGRTYNEVRTLLVKKRNEAQPQRTKCSATFGELAKEWLSSVKNSIKESTYANYFCKLQKHILPKLGRIKYEKLTANFLNDFSQEKLSEDLSAKYVSDILNVIKAITRFAGRAYNCEDKAANVIAPKDRKLTEKPVLDSIQQKKLLSYLAEEPSASNVGIAMTLMTGLRVGELCALQWKDIDLKNGLVNVTKTMQRIQDFEGKKATKIIIGTPKSKTSVRSIPIPKPILNMLKTLKAGDEEFFLTGKDLYAEPRTMQYRFQSILKKLRLPKFNFHALRHTFATNCATLGFDAKTLSELLGHSSVEITLNRYVHSSLDRKRYCMEMLSRQFSGRAAM